MVARARGTLRGKGGLETIRETTGRETCHPAQNAGGMVLEDGESMRDRLLDLLCAIVERLGLIDWRSLQNLDGKGEFED